MKSNALTSEELRIAIVTQMAGRGWCTGREMACMLHSRFGMNRNTGYKVLHVLVNRGRLARRRRDLGGGYCGPLGQQTRRTVYEYSADEVQERAAAFEVSL